jgi:hypothetical protein
MAKNGSEKVLGGRFPIKIVTRSDRIEDIMRPVQSALYQQMQVVLRAPIMSYAIADASKTLNEYVGEDAVKVATEVGSLTEKPLLNIEDFCSTWRYGCYIYFWEYGSASKIKL